MAGRVRGGVAGGRDAPETYPDTMSGYGPTRADSRGEAAKYPYAYKSQALTAYTKAAMQVNKGTRNGGS